MDVPKLSSSVSLWVYVNYRNNDPFLQFTTGNENHPCPSYPSWVNYTEPQQLVNPTSNNTQGTIS